MNSPFRRARAAAGKAQPRRLPPANAPRAGYSDEVALDPRSEVDRPAERAASMMRKFEVLALTRDGDIRSSSHIAPAHPLFENAASAFVRGTILQTEAGPMAVEDLLPGDRLRALDGAPLKVMWIGSTMIVPSASGQREEMSHTWRITADKFGIGRPMPDLMLGQGARLLVERSALSGALGTARALMQVGELADEMGLIRLTPPSPVRTYHVALERHAAIRAAGLEVESYHPGENAIGRVGRNMASLYLSIFPHIETPEDFGPLAFPRVSRAILDGLSAA